MRRARDLTCLAWLCCLSGTTSVAGCSGSPLIVPTSAVMVANGLQLRTLAPEIHLEVTEARAPVVVALDGTEVAGTYSIAGHASIVRAEGFDQEVARVEGDKVVAVAPGQAKLRFENELGSFETPIVVHDAPPSALVVDGVPLAHVGEPVAVKATLTWAEGPSDATYDVIWSTNLPDELHIPTAPTAHGWIASLKPSTTAIGALLTATYGTLMSQTRVVPIAEPIDRIEIRLAWSWMNRRRFGAWAWYRDGQEREISGGCLWTAGGKQWRAATGDAPLGPQLRADEVSWDRMATCTVAGVRGSGSLFSP